MDRIIDRVSCVIPIFRQLGLITFTGTGPQSPGYSLSLYRISLVRKLFILSIMFTFDVGCRFCTSKRIRRLFKGPLNSNDIVTILVSFDPF